MENMYDKDLEEVGRWSKNISSVLNSISTILIDLQSSNYLASKGKHKTVENTFVALLRQNVICHTV